MKLKPIGSNQKDEMNVGLDEYVTFFTRARRITLLGSNQTEVELADGTIIFYSYNTPVAVFVPEKGGLCSDHKYGAFTSRHINATIERWGCSRTDVSQNTINQLAG